MAKEQATPAQEVNSENKMVLGKVNYIIIGISIVIILIGFILMMGSSSTMETFDADIFSPRRIIVGPNLCLLGYVLIIVGILIKGKK